MFPDHISQQFVNGYCVFLGFLNPVSLLLCANVEAPFFKYSCTITLKNQEKNWKVQSFGYRTKSVFSNTPFRRYHSLQTLCHQSGVFLSFPWRTLLWYSWAILTIYLQIFNDVQFRGLSRPFQNFCLSSVMKYTIWPNVCEHKTITSIYGPSSYHNARNKK